jgi:hypothetical protein
MFLPGETQADEASKQSADLDLSAMTEPTSMAIEDMMNNPEGFDWVSAFLTFLSPVSICHISPKHSIL